MNLYHSALQLLCFCSCTLQAGGSGGPLSECTNKRASSGQLTAPAAKKQQVQQDVQQIDLCDDDDDDNTAAAAAAQATGDPTAQAHEGRQQQDQAQACEQQEQDRQDQQQGQQQDQQQQQQGEAAMEVDAEPLVMSTPAPGSNAGTPAGTPAPPAAAAAAAADKEPATPEDGLGAASLAAAAPSALKSTGGKPAAEVLLTPEQRTQLLEVCQKVCWGSGARTRRLRPATSVGAACMHLVMPALMQGQAGRERSSSQQECPRIGQDSSPAMHDSTPCLSWWACRSCRCLRLSWMCGLICQGTWRLTRSHWTSNTR